MLTQLLTMITSNKFPSLQDVAVVQIEFLVPALGGVGDVLGRSEVLGRVTEAGTQRVPAPVHPLSVPSLPEIRKKRILMFDNPFKKELGNFLYFILMLLCFKVNNYSLLENAMKILRHTVQCKG